MVKEMEEVKYVKHLWEKDGKSLREIAKTLKINFRTAQKYAYKDNWNIEKKQQQRKKIVLEQYINIIDTWLVDDLRAPRKQRHTAKKIYKRLVKEHNFSGSYSGLAKYVSNKKLEINQKKEGYLPLAHYPCHAQIDFGEIFYYNIVGELVKGYELVISFPYSNAGFVQVFKSQNQECLLEGMKRIFTYINGTPFHIKADNMTTAVATILEGKERILTEGFLRFKLHYRFETEFCNPASGNEKGNVENKVGYKRRNYFVPVPVIEDFEAFNQSLWQLCEEDMDREHYKKKITIRELWEEERLQLLKLPSNEYDVFKYESGRVSPTGFVIIDKNKYAVSPELNGKLVQMKIWYNKIEFFYEHSLIKTYNRSYLENEEIYDWKQYLYTLCKKPGAVEHTRFFDQIPKLWGEYLKSKQGKERKNALILLKEIVSDNKLTEYDAPLELSMLYGKSDIESIRQCYYSITNYEFKPQPIKLKITTPISNYSPVLGDYDNLLIGGSGRCMNN